jgi:SAM-dependent methyltransferase
MSPEVVPRVESGFANALNYDAYRPSYPQESVDNLFGALRVLGLTKARLLDLGAGTGKLTEQLIAKAEGYDIVAVDPHPQMLEFLVQKRLPRVRAIKGTASNMAVIETGWADAIVVAQVSYCAKIFANANNCLRHSTGMSDNTLSSSSVTTRWIIVWGSDVLKGSQTWNRCEKSIGSSNQAEVWG